MFAHLFNAGNLKGVGDDECAIVFAFPDSREVLALVVGEDMSVVHRMSGTIADAVHLFKCRTQSLSALRNVIFRKAMSFV